MRKEQAVTDRDGHGGHGVGQVALVAGLAALFGGCGAQSSLLGTDVMDPQNLSGLPAVAVASDGATYVAEPFHGSVDIDPLGPGDRRSSSSDGMSTVLWRTDIAGNRGWVKVLDDGGARSISASPRSNDGSLIVGSYAAVTKLSAVGDVLWTTPCSAATCTADSPAAIATADGGAAVLAENRVMRFQADGGLAWLSTLTAAQVGLTSADLYFGNLVEAPDGTLLVVGGGDFYTGFILRLDASGNLLRTRYTAASEAGPTPLASFSNMAVMSDGSVLAFGWYQGTVDFDDGPGEMLRSAGSGAVVFAMRLKSDLSLDQLFELRNANSPDLLVATSDGGLLTVDHRVSELRGITTQPHVAKLRPNMGRDWELQVGGSLTYIGRIASGNDVFAVVGTATSTDEAPGTNSRGSVFVARYRL
jgi:hypothetical protein